MSTEVRYEMALELDKLIRNQQQRALSMSRDDVERYLGEKASEFDAEAWYIFRRNLAKGREGMVKELIGRGN